MWRHLSITTLGVGPLYQYKYVKTRSGLLVTLYSRSSQAPTTDHPPFLFCGACRASRSIYSSHPTSLPTLLMHLPSQVSVDIHHAVFSPLSSAPPLGSVFLASPGCHRSHLDLDGPQRLTSTLLSSGPGANDDADDDDVFMLN